MPPTPLHPHPLLHQTSSQYTDVDAESQNFLPSYTSQGKKKYEVEYVSTFMRYTMKYVDTWPSGPSVFFPQKLLPLSWKPSLWAVALQFPLAGNPNLFKH